jgi:uncharacterized OB-fold protein
MLEAELVARQREKAHGVDPPNCPVCSSRVQDLHQGRATLFECEACGFKFVTTRELYPHCFTVDPSELWPPVRE